MDTTLYLGFSFPHLSFRKLLRVTKGREHVMIRNLQQREKFRYFWFFNQYGYEQVLWPSSSDDISASSILMSTKISKCCQKKIYAIGGTFEDFYDVMIAVEDEGTWTYGITSFNSRQELLQIMNMSESVQHEERLSSIAAQTQVLFVVSSDVLCDNCVNAEFCHGFSKVCLYDAYDV